MNKEPSFVAIVLKPSSGENWTATKQGLQPKAVLCCLLSFQTSVLRYLSFFTGASVYYTPGESSSSTISELLSSQVKKKKKTRKEIQKKKNTFIGEVGIIN